MEVQNIRLLGAWTCGHDQSLRQFKMQILTEVNSVLLLFPLLFQGGMILRLKTFNLICKF